MSYRSYLHLRMGQSQVTLLLFKEISDPRNNRVELILGTGEWGQGEIPETMIRGLRSSHLRGNSVPRME